MLQPLEEAIGVGQFWLILDRLWPISSDSLREGAQSRIAFDFATGSTGGRLRSALDERLRLRGGNQLNVAAQRRDGIVGACKVIGSGQPAKAQQYPASNAGYREQR